MLVERPFRGPAFVDSGKAVPIGSANRWEKVPNQPMAARTRGNVLQTPEFLSFSMRATASSPHEGP